MGYQDPHISDQDLILLADGEQPGRRATQIEAHVATCGICRARLNEFHKALTDVVSARNDSFDIRSASADGSRSLFKARLSQLAAQHPETLWQRLKQLNPIGPRVAYVLGSFVLAFALLMLWPSSPSSLAWSPNPELTPGVALPVTDADICGKQPGRERPVVEAVGKKVFELYGIRNPQPRHYEMDYLIDPDLGGSDDARNLWPQPYSATWNARLKDALEIQLRELVCMQQLTLAEAQRDISADWISAYKRYFHTDHPLPEHQTFSKDQPWE